MKQGMEEEGARWPHRSSKPAWRLILLPEGSTPSPLRHFSPQSSWILLLSATRVPTGARDVLGDLPECRAQLALRADRIAAVYLVAPAAEPAGHAARNPGALEVARRAPPQVVKHSAGKPSRFTGLRPLFAQHCRQAAISVRPKERRARRVIGPAANLQRLGEAKNPGRDRRGRS